VTGDHPTLTVPALVDCLGLTPMPLRGGMFRRVWAGPPMLEGRPAGSAIIVLLSTADDTFSAMHRLPVDEVWHFYLGDTLELLLLYADGSWRIERLGHDLASGQHVQFTVPAGTWMGATVTDGGRWSLFGCTMAPGFVAEDYEGGRAADLCEAYPEAQRHIHGRCRPGAPLRHFF